VEELEKKVGRQLRKWAMEVSDAAEAGKSDSYASGYIQALEMVLRMMNPNSKWLEWVTPVNELNEVVDER
jgi:hypothetical protein